jgi:hypothetical protein
MKDRSPDNFLFQICDDYLFQFMTVDDASWNLMLICDNFSFQFVMIDDVVVVEMSPNLVPFEARW